MSQYWQTFAAALVASSQETRHGYLTGSIGTAARLERRRSGVSCSDRTRIVKPNLTDVVEETVDVLSSVSRFALQPFP